MASQDARLSMFEANFKQQQSEMTNKINIMLKAIIDRIAGILPSDTVKNPKLSTYLVLSTRSYPTEDPQCSNQTYGSINAITIHTEQQSTSYDDGERENKEEEDNPNNIYINPPTPPDPSVTFITENVLKFNSFLESLGLVPSSSNTELIFTKEEDGDVVLGRPFIKVSNMTHDLPEGVVRFTNKNDEVAYKMPHKIEQYNSLSNLEKEHTKSVYLRNEEDKKRGVDYVTSKILWFYKECLELGPEYVAGIEEKGEVTLYLTRRSLEDLRMLSFDDSWRMF
nr:protein kinase-like domain, concanavalin A-like lectin/glucanase domain protein [Tanacetum cinerariifolium]